MSEEIDAAKVEAICNVLKDALPELVHIAFTQFKADVPRILPGLSDDDWLKIRGDEDRRRSEAAIEVAAELRQLAEQLARVCQESPCLASAGHIVHTCCNHLRLLAGWHEAVLKEK